MSTPTIPDDAPWTSSRFAVVDLEGNGQQPPDLVELAVIPVDDGVPGPARAWLVKPDKIITQRVTRIHGITNADVKMAPRFEAVSADVQASLEGRCLVAHNAIVDWDVIQRKLPSLRLPAVIDTLRLSRALYPSRKSYSLSNLVSDLGLQDGLKRVAGRPHRAMYDATAALDLFRLLAGGGPRGLLTFRQVLSMSQLPGTGALRQQDLFS